MHLFAMADLHLSLDGKKPMHVFGELWRDHPARMAEAWDAVVSPEDQVLLAGDLSWARKLSEAGQDLAWIAERPGSKLLLRGNHDSWWASRSKLAAALDPSCAVLQNDAHEWGDWVIIGARGWLAPDDPIATEADGKIFERELERLEASIADADRRFGTERPRIAMAHYPPWLVGREPTAVVERLRRAGVKHCVYGHLHGEDHAMALTGTHDSVTFHFVAVDANAFKPVRLPVEPRP